MESTVDQETSSEAKAKPQVNVQLAHEEFEALKQICEADGINRPATLVGIWIRNQIKARSGLAEEMEAIREAKNAGVNVIETLARATRRKSSSS